MSSYSRHNSTCSAKSAEPNRMSVMSRKSIISKRNGLEDDEEEERQKSILLQTCKDTGVGDCPACLGTRTNCHTNECQLCCDVKVCGPKFRNCPFHEGQGTQTEPCRILDVSCQCGDNCLPGSCMRSGSCGFSGLQCRCISRSCNTSGTCIILEDDMDCPFTETDCKCEVKGCDYARDCLLLDENDPLFADYRQSMMSFDPELYDQQLHEEQLYDQQFPMVNPTSEPYDPDEIIWKCHALCQTNIPQTERRPPKHRSRQVICLPNQNKESQVRMSRPQIRTKGIGSRSTTHSSSDGDYARSRPQSCYTREPSPITTSGDETDHYSIIVDEKGCQTPPLKVIYEMQSRKSDTGVLTTQKTGVRLEKPSCRSSGASIKVSSSTNIVKSDPAPIPCYPKQSSKMKKAEETQNQKPLKMVCVRESQFKRKPNPKQVKSPYCPNPETCKICKPRSRLNFSFRIKKI